MRGWLWIDCRRGVTQVRPDDWQVVAIGRLARGRGGVKGYSRYIKGHAAQARWRGGGGGSRVIPDKGPCSARKM